MGKWTADAEHTKFIDFFFCEFFHSPPQRKNRNFNMKCEVGEWKISLSFFTLCKNWKNHFRQPRQSSHKRHIISRSLLISRLQLPFTLWLCLNIKFLCHKLLIFLLISMCCCYLSLHHCYIQMSSTTFLSVITLSLPPLRVLPLLYHFA